MERHQETWLTIPMCYKSTRSEQISWLGYINLLLRNVGIIPCTYAIMATCMNRHGNPLSIIKVKVTQSCPTLCNPMDYTVYGILQPRILEWVAFPFSRGSSQPRDRTQVSALRVDSSPTEPQEKPKNTGVGNGSSRPRNQTGLLHCRRFFTNWAWRFQNHSLKVLQKSDPPWPCSLEQSYSLDIVAVGLTMTWYFYSLTFHINYMRA